jgi:heme O synthase-like polyprenyltransferase
MGLGLLTLALQLWADKTRRNARRVFLATIAYLPLLLLLMVADSSSHLRASAEQTALLPAESSATR